MEERMTSRKQYDAASRHLEEVESARFSAGQRLSMPIAPTYSLAVIPKNTGQRYRLNGETRCHRLDY